MARISKNSNNASDTPKPKKPRVSKKKVTEALDKHLAPSQKFIKPKKPRAKKIKLVELDTPTFGPLITDTRNCAGFVYKVTCTTHQGTRYYVGSKTFDEAGSWKNYCTSSETVQRLIDASRKLPDACKVKLEVLELVPTSGLLKIRENVCIRGMYSLVGKDRCINVADAFGISLRTGKSLRK